MRIKIIRYVSLLLLLLWMGVIFAFSAQKAGDSSEVSRDVVVTVASIVYPDYESLDEAGKTELINRFLTPIRKLAHFAEFALLGALATVFFATFSELSLKIKALFPFIIGVLYAMSDEIHQMFVDGRACRLSDVLIDTAGVLLPVVLGYIINRKTAGERNEQ